MNKRRGKRLLFKKILNSIYPTSNLFSKLTIQRNLSICNFGMEENIRCSITNIVKAILGQSFLNLSDYYLF